MMGEPERIPEPHEQHRADEPEPQKQLPINQTAIISLVISAIGFFVFSIVLGPAAIVVGAIGLSQVMKEKGAAQMNSQQMKGMLFAAGGVVLGIIDIVAWIVVVTQSPGL